MMIRARCISSVAAMAVVAMASHAAWAQSTPAGGNDKNWQPLSLAQATTMDKKADSTGAAPAAAAPMEPAEEMGFRGVSDFFNVREANPTNKLCETHFELTAIYSTYSSAKHHDDDFALSPGIRYGITEDFYMELNVRPINFFDGNAIDGTENYAKSGNGDLGVVAFWRFMRETDSMPAMALWSLVRGPTGYGSNGIDASLNLNATKNLGGGFRVHATGFVKTANGAQGDRDREDVGDPRNFQWGLGPAVDFQLDDQNLLVFNYLNSASQNYGSHNSGVVEAGWVHSLTANQTLKVAVNAETHSEQADGPHWTGKVQYTISW